METKEIIYSKLKHNTNLLNFILFFIAKFILESIEQVKAFVKDLLNGLKPQAA
jgi:hypothetical protein